MINALADSIGWIDLSTESIWTENALNYRGFIGGRGVGSWLVFREVPLGTDPLGPQNIITFNTGPLTGTLAPTCGRLNVSTKNVLTGGISFSNAGGHFAPELKCAGFDHLIIKGKATRPIYIFVHDGKIEIRDAGRIWGLDAWEAEDAIKRELGDPQISVAAIGQAGENLVKGACIMVDMGRAAAWGGSGAVMGSKRVKAVAVRGTNGIDVHSPTEFLDMVRAMWNKMDNSSSVRMLRRYGTLGSSGVGGIDGSSPMSSKNMEDGVWPAEKMLKVREILLKEKFETRRLADFACPAYCSHFYHVKDGPFSDFKLEGLEVNLHRAFGSNVDVDSPIHILKATELADRYGINCDEASATIAWAIECFEKGLIDKNVTGGMELRWGDGDAVVKLLQMIAFRQGFGNVLAEGVFRAAEQIQRGTEAYAVHCKKAGMSEQGVRSHKGWALGIVTSTRGGGHLAGAPNTEQQRISKELSQERFGISTAGMPFEYEGKGKLVHWFEKFNTIVDMAGLCTFTSIWTDPCLMTADDYANMIRLATGWPVDGEELMYVGDKVYNIEKAFNTLHAGFKRENDLPPNKWVEIPVSAGEFAGQKLNLDKWDKMLDEYYESHDWDRQTSWQKRSCLEKLGLQQVAEALAEEGRLIED